MKMFERYLAALQYTGTQPVNIDDPKEFRSLISWLEDQKIRHYTIENREQLKQLGSVDVWDAAYDKYKTDVGLPYELATRQEQLTWLLLHAVRLEYSDNVDTYRPLSGARKAEAEQKKATAPEVKSTNPFDSLDFTNAQFEEGARKLADRLGIAYHPDHLVSLRAAGRVIHDCLNREALKEPLITGQPYVGVGAAAVGSNGTPAGKPPTPAPNEREVEKAAQILRLLQIRNMRSLQTTINETIVAVQNVTADPKTDSALGKVGV